MFRPQKKPKKKSPAKKAEKALARQRTETEFNANIERIRAQVLADEAIMMKQKNVAQECRRNHRYLYRHEILVNVMDHLSVFNILQWTSCNKKMYDLFFTEGSPNYVLMQCNKLKLARNLFQYVEYSRYDEYADTDDVHSDVNNMMKDCLPLIQTIKCSGVDFLDFANKNNCGSPATAFLFSAMVGDYDSLQKINSVEVFEYNDVAEYTFVLAVMTNRPNNLEKVIDCISDLMKYIPIVSSLVLKSNNPALLQILLECGEKYVTNENIKNWQKHLIAIYMTACDGYVTNDISDEMIETLIPVLKTTFLHDSIKLMYNVYYLLLNSTRLISRVVFWFNFYSDPQWIKYLNNIMDGSIFADNLEMINYMLGLDYMQGNFDKCSMLSAVLGKKNSNLIDLLIRHFSWNIDEDFEYRKTEICELLCDVSDVTRQFLVNNNFDPAFGDCRLLSSSIEALDIAIVEYCLNYKSAEMDYLLHTNDFFKKVAHRLGINCYHRSKANADEVAKCEKIVKLFLDDGRICPHLDTNDFFKSVLKSKYVKIIELLIESGRIFFPYCLTTIAAYDDDSEIVSYFASHPIYYKQIAACKEKGTILQMMGSYREKIVKLHNTTNIL